MGLFSTLNTGVSGLTSSQSALATVSHNISNANTEFYTRQRITNSANYSKTSHLNVGLGVNVDKVVRLHDEFVYNRMKTAATKLEYSTFSKKTLEEAAKYFPDLQKAGENNKAVGLKENLADYYKAWNNFSSNTSEGAQKINLITTAQTFTANLQNTRSRLRALQNSLNDQFKAAINEINSIGKRIAAINGEISRIEAIEPTTANDLRDQRDKLETTLAKLVNSKAFKGDIKSDSSGLHYAESGEKYNLNISGFSFVHGSDFNPITISNDKNPSAYYTAYFEREDGTLFDMTSSLQGGKVGAMLDLRGRTIDVTSKGGYPKDGTLQSYIDDLDTFAKTLAVQTNNVYAKVAQKDSSSVMKKGLEGDRFLMGHDRYIKKGSFDVVVYDKQGKEVARKSININETTSLNNNTLGNSIVEDFNKDTDDNNDNDRTNDVNDFYRAKYSFSSDSNSGHLIFERASGKDGYTISVEDKGTNFSGVMGMNSFFKGDSAKNLSVADNLVKNPDSLEGYASPASGNNDVANAMVQTQYQQFSFKRADGSSLQESIEGFYRFTTSNIATDAESARIQNDTNTALHTTVNNEFQSVSGVNLDEELADLMKFQTAYSSNAKVLTTIDKMLDALLSIK